MTNQSIHKTELIAPCGMNCRVCLGFERKKKPCFGCRANQELDSRYNCIIRNCQKRGNHDNCSECENRCARLKRLDKRYREKYGYSPIHSLDIIHALGMEAFLKNQEIFWTCESCQGLLCVHRWACPECGAPRPNVISAQELDDRI